MSVNDALKASRLFTENKQGKPVGPHEFIIFRKDSSKVPVEMRAFPVDVNSQRLVFSVVRDVSERKLAERKAIETEKRFRGLYENSTLGIYRSTQEGRIVMANPAAVALLGFDSLDELLKINIADYYSDILVDRSAFKKIMDSEGVAHGFEFQWKRPDGSIIYLKESARTILNEKGKVEFYEGIFEDVTDKRKAEETLIKAKEEAEELSRLKSNFLANMSHELRTPLIGIEGYAEILYNELKEDELKQMARNIEASSDRLSKALDLILDFSMLEANKLKINSKRVNIVNAVKELINPYKKAAREKGLEFSFISDEEELFSYVDTNLFSRSVRHILDNSIKFTKHGEVGVKIFANGMINIQISDTGIGIPDDKMKIIFNPFRQISEGNSRLFQGIGLGLTLAKKFTEVSGGKVLVESKVGKGTSFTILLPEAKSMEEFK
jgi:PAS domain S-box-containing protein